MTQTDRDTPVTALREAARGLNDAARTLIDQMDRHGLDNLALFEQQVEHLRGHLLTDILLASSDDVAGSGEPAEPEDSLGAEYGCHAHRGWHHHGGFRHTDERREWDHEDADHVHFRPDDVAGSGERLREADPESVKWEPCGRCGYMNPAGTIDLSEYRVPADEMPTEAANFAIEAAAPTTEAPPKDALPNRPPKPPRSTDREMA